MPRIISKSCNSKGIKSTSISYPVKLTSLPHIYYLFQPCSPSEFQLRTLFLPLLLLFPNLLTIFLAMNECVAPGLNNTCTLRLFISSIPATTSVATLTSSCVRWKILLKVWSFCFTGLPQLEFAPD